MWLGTRRALELGFELSEEQRMVLEATRELAQGLIRAGAAERDEHERFPLELLPALAEHGLLAMKVSPEDGGSGLDNLSYVLAMAAIAEACASTAVILASSNLATKILADHASPEQRRRWLVPYAKGALGPASFALTEPHAGSDARALKTHARKDGGGWILDGAKMWITSAAQAGLHLVFANTDPAAGTRGITCFVVERGTPGLLVGKEERKMGLRSSGTAALVFEGCRVDDAERVGEVGEGYTIALTALGAGRIGIAGQSLGIAEAAFEAGLRYAAERQAFGQRILDFQNTQFTLADTRTELDAAWLLMLSAARMLDRGERARAESSMAKVAASEACGRAVDRMLQLHGGYGYSREFPIERYYRDARVTRIYEGTNEIQRTLIARALIKAVS
ncbi:MAG: acyl-CoA dehydrogenase family protein [Sandaracinaceae bacterium]|nr:acyl-CoA dehydrogenase family protein [Sandaracinaceae bacterium]